MPSRSMPGAGAAATVRRLPPLRTSPMRPAPAAMPKALRRRTLILLSWKGAPPAGTVARRGYRRFCCRGRPDARTAFNLLMRWLVVYEKLRQQEPADLNACISSIRLPSVVLVAVGEVDHTLQNDRPRS